MDKHKDGIVYYTEPGKPGLIREDTGSSFINHRTAVSQVHVLAHLKRSSVRWVGDPQNHTVRTDLCCGVLFDR
ncbi:hypothetical protein NPIL_65011 [Nephila pilipes]|uniref:Uncharacterized protein n=1 Tax=Nephila pilipes TaxID=299642 RepID=A0A8X6Q451_NEPPI|nr:hypothetical protein NPIL_65011 [Nephila pilipes]